MICGDGLNDGISKIVYFRKRNDDFWCIALFLQSASYISPRDIAFLFQIRLIMSWYIFCVFFFFDFCITSTNTVARKRVLSKEDRQFNSFLDILLGLRRKTPEDTRYMFFSFGIKRTYIWCLQTIIASASIIETENI